MIDRRYGSYEVLRGYSLVTVALQERETQNSIVP